MTAENDPGQLFRAVGDITKHNDISHISQINRSKSVEQFCKQYDFVLHPKKKITVQFAALYYGVSICLVTFASAMAVVTLNIHHMGLRGKDVSTRSLWLKVCFQGKDVSAINQSRCSQLSYGNTGDNSFRVKDYGTLACGLSDMFSHSLVNGHCI